MVTRDDAPVTAFGVVHGVILRAPAQEKTTIAGLLIRRQSYVATQSGDETTVNHCQTRCRERAVKSAVLCFVSETTRVELASQNWTRLLKGATSLGGRCKCRHRLETTQPCGTVNTRRLGSSHWLVPRREAAKGEWVCLSMSQSRLQALPG